MELTRRHSLAGAAGIATAPLLPSVSAQAAAPMAEKQAPSFYRYKVGDVQVNAIFDGSLRSISTIVLCSMPRKTK